MTINEVVNGYFDDKAWIASNITTAINNVIEIRELVYPNGNINALPIDSLEQDVERFSEQGRDTIIQSIQDGVAVYNNDRELLNKIYNDLMAIVAQVNNDYTAKSHKSRTVTYTINPLGTEPVMFDDIDDAVNQYDNDFHLYQNIFTQLEEEIDNLYNDVEEWYDEATEMGESDGQPTVTHVEADTVVIEEAKQVNIVVGKPSMGTKIKNFFRKIFG